MSTAILIFASMPANAISRYYSKKLSCAAIHRILSTEKAAVLRYPSTRIANLTLYDRYVRNESYCFPHQVGEIVKIPSRDWACTVMHGIQEPDLCDLDPSCRD